LIHIRLNLWPWCKYDATLSRSIFWCVILARRL
jgi:hypothetical protein